jgi:4-hydroxymandelate oxidase
MDWSFPIMAVVDSGIRSGQDVFKAVALGADAVCIGRPYIWGLAAEGAMGVAKVIRTLRDELEMTMALTGVANLKALRQVSLF